MEIEGVLVEPFTTRLLSGVQEWFEQKPDDVKVIVTSNQGGVGLRLWMETVEFGNPSRLPTDDDVMARILRIFDQLPRNSFSGVYVAYHYQSKGGSSPRPALDPLPRWWLPSWRKPNTDMLLAAGVEAGGLTRDQFKDDLAVVGVHRFDVDAAKALGADFLHADVLFGRARLEDSPKIIE
jgi:histidinol phosphatase-like enzyme